MLSSTKQAYSAMNIRDGEDQNQLPPGVADTLSKESHRQPPRGILPRSTSRRRDVERQDESININIKHKPTEKDEQQQMVSFNQETAGKTDPSPTRGDEKQDQFYHYLRKKIMKTIESGENTDKNSKNETCAKILECIAYQDGNGTNGTRTSHRRSKKAASKPRNEKKHFITSGERDLQKYSLAEEPAPPRSHNKSFNQGLVSLSKQLKGKKPPHNGSVLDSSNAWQKVKYSQRTPHDATRDPTSADLGMYRSSSHRGSTVRSKPYKFENDFNTINDYSKLESMNPRSNSRGQSRQSRSRSRKRAKSNRSSKMRFEQLHDYDD